VKHPLGRFTKHFLDQVEKVKALKDQLVEEERKLQGMCCHLDFSGKSAFPPGISFTNCSICGLSNHDL
jgi:hypothetical protein